MRLMNTTLMSTEQTTTSREDIEQGFLSCIGLSGERLIDAVAEGVDESWFTRASHQRLWNLCKSFEGDDMVDISVLTSSELDSAERDEAQLIFSRCDTPTGFWIYFKELKDLVKKRELQKYAYKILDSIEERQESDQIVAFCDGELTKMQQVEVKTLRSGTEVVIEAEKRLAERQESGTSIIGIKSGIQRLDLYTKGFKKSQLVIVAARTSIGKTAFSVELAIAALNEGRKTYYVSLEMEAEEVMQRMQSNLSGVPVAPIEDCTAKATDVERWKNATEWLKKKDHETLWIDDEPSLCFSQIRARARKLSRKGLDYMIVDYAQIISSERGKESESAYNRVSYISRMFKVLARELGIPVILLAQLSRKADERDGKPRLSDLKESGSLEQDADIVIFLWKKDDSPEERQLNIAKLRNGKLGDIELLFDGATSKFTRKPVLN